MEKQFPFISKQWFTNKIRSTPPPPKKAPTKIRRFRTKSSLVFQLGTRTQNDRKNIRHFCNDLIACSTIPVFTIPAIPATVTSRIRSNDSQLQRAIDAEYWTKRKSKDL